MRDAALWAVLALAFALVVACVVLGSQPQAEHKPLRHAYYPFTIELSVRDR